MASDQINFDDTESMWPPEGRGEVPPLTGPQMTGMRLDSIEQRLANIERGRGDLERYLVDMAESTRVAMDAPTYLSGAVERVRVLLLADRPVEGK